MAGTTTTLNLFQLYHDMCIITLFFDRYIVILPYISQIDSTETELYTQSSVYDDGKRCLGGAYQTHSILEGPFSYLTLM